MQALAEAEQASRGDARNERYDKAIAALARFGVRAGRGLFPTAHRLVYSYGGSCQVSFQALIAYQKEALWQAKS